MTALYLTEIELSEFRSFAHLKITLAPEPGVLIVHGSNGLGKSSLFDALEWTLTGDIDHFRSADGYKKFSNYLRRWGSGVSSTSCTISFSDDKRIVRELASAKAATPTLKGDVTDIAEYLRVPAWRQSISALNRYLLLTHFLGQSSLSRLTHRNPGERFAILKEAAQSADLEKFGLALHGPGTTQPARAFAKRIVELKRDATDLHVLLDQEAETWSAAQAAGAIDNTEAYALSQEILVKASRAWAYTTEKPVQLVSTDPSDMTALQTTIDQTQAEVRQRAFAISEARRMLALRQRQEKTYAEAAASAEQADREITASTSAADEARQLCAAQRAALEALLPPLTIARDVHVQLTTLAQADMTLQAARAEVEQTSAILVSARTAVVNADEAMQRSARPAQIVERLRGELNELLKSLQRTRAQIDKGRQWLANFASIEASQSELSALEQTNPHIEESLADARQAVEVARAAVQTEAKALQIIKESVDELSAAVSTIALHLPVGEHECPTCSAYYTSPAELRQRIDAVAGRLAPAVVAQEAALQVAEEALSKITVTLTSQEGVSERIGLLKTLIRADREENSRLLVELGWALETDFAKMQTQLADLEHAVELIEGRRARRLRWFNLLERGRDTTAAIANARRHRDEAQLSATAAARRHADAVAAERLASDTFSALSARLLPELSSPTKSHIEAAIQAAAATLALAQGEYDAARAALAEQESRLAPLQEAEAILKARLERAVSERDQTQKAMTSLVSQWRSAGWTEADKDEPRIENAATNLARALDSLSEAGTMLKRLREGREAWVRQQSHRAIFERLAAEVDNAPNSTREQIREAVANKLSHIEEEVRATVRSKEIAFKASTAIATAVSTFNAEYIEPLDRLTKCINQAILCDPRIGIGLHVNKKTIKQSALRDGELPAKRKIDPMLVHSEGQMAALAVSMLCAASLTYPWSRWRALILDDPLQHNDAIHAAAFADMVGNLVQAKDYQILLSTHDLGQADFLRRKFEARKIPCAVLNLLGRGQAGVEAEFLPAKGVGTAASATA